MDTAGGVADALAAFAADTGLPRTPRLDATLVTRLDALAAAVRSAPRDRELVRATFIARGEIYNMRQVFEYYRRIGYF